MKSSIGMVALGLLACASGAEDESQAIVGVDGSVQSGVALSDVERTDLVASAPSGYAVVDPQLIGAGALVFHEDAAWVTAANSVRSYTVQGRQALPPLGSEAPTGLALSADPAVFRGDRVIVATAQGTLIGWQPSRAEVRYSGAAPFSGLAIGRDCGGRARLYAASFSGAVEVLDASYALVSSDRFRDPDLPAGFTPHNIIAEELKGAGRGYVDLFDLDGALLARLIRGDGRADLVHAGTYAEYAAVRAGDLAAKPRSLDHVHAAAVPTAGLTAWQALFGGGGARGIGLDPGQSLFVQGAASGTGAFAVQLARWRGAVVIAACDRAHAAFVRELGAHVVVDSRAPFAGVDAALDLEGGSGSSGPGKIASSARARISAGERSSAGR